MFRCRSVPAPVRDEAAADRSSDTPFTIVTTHTVDSRVGGTVGFTFTVSNTNGEKVSNVSLSNSLAGVSKALFGSWPSGVSGVLENGQSITATASYKLKQSDLDAGSVITAPMVTALLPNGQRASVIGDTVEVSLADAFSLGADELACTGTQTTISIAVAVMALVAGGAFLVIRSTRSRA